tara:strand:- start:4629 stop:4814 length:186 start_codon:yes stop_codon:yes gene_type:complete
VSGYLAQVLPNCKLDLSVFMLSLSMARYGKQLTKTGAKKPAAKKPNITTAPWVKKKKHDKG